MKYDKNHRKHSLFLKFLNCVSHNLKDQKRKSCQSLFFTELAFCCFSSLNTRTCKEHGQYERSYKLQSFFLGIQMTDLSVTSNHSLVLANPNGTEPDPGNLFQPL